MKKLNKTGKKKKDEKSSNSTRAYTTGNGIKNMR